jgi:gluconokinase
MSSEHYPIIGIDRAEKPFVLAIDIGTSAARAVLFDRLGRSITAMQARGAFGVRATADGGSEVDADALLEAVWQCLDTLLDRAGSSAEAIAGVAACTFVGNILGLNENGQAVTPIYTYADTRAEDEVAGLKADFDEVAAHDRTGCHFHSSYLPARFRWLARAHPKLFRSVKRWMSLGEYLEFKLFGRPAVSYSVASWSGLLDRQRLQWDDILLAKLPITQENLSPLVDVRDCRQGLLEPFARRWPQLTAIPWFPAIGDGAASNLGSGCTSPGKVALTMGTTTAVRVVVDTPIPQVPKGLWCYRVDGRRSLPGGALSEGGGLFAWLTSTLNLGDPENLESAIQRTKPDKHGLTVLPFLSGERAPGWQGHARATIHGLSEATTPVEILRAAMEAVAYRVALVFERLSELLPEDFCIIASGGALRSSASWLQIMADVLGRPTVLSGVQEASARGAALLALEALGLLSFRQLPDSVERTCEPNAEHHRRYVAALQRHKQLYEKLIREH